MAAPAEVAWTCVRLARAARCLALQAVGGDDAGHRRLKFYVTARFEGASSSASCWGVGLADLGEEGLRDAVSAHVVSVYVDCNQEREYM